MKKEYFKMLENIANEENSQTIFGKVKIIDAYRREIERQEKKTDYEIVITEMFSALVKELKLSEEGKKFINKYKEKLLLSVEKFIKERK